MNTLVSPLIKTTRRKQNLPENNITDTSYADILYLLSDNFEDAQLFLTQLEEAAATVGLHMNASKTEYMACNITGSLVSFNGQALKSVN